MTTVALATNDMIKLITWYIISRGRYWMVFVNVWGQDEVN